MLNKFAIAATLAASLVGAAHAQQTTTGAATPIQGQVLNTLAREFDHCHELLQAERV